MVFYAVMKHGSVSGAARMLRVSQPAVTKTLHLMEAEIGLPLFTRIRGRLQPTPEAELLLPEVEKLYGAVDSVQHLANQIREGHSGKIVVAASSSLASSLLATAIARFRSDWPTTNIDVRAYPTKEVVDQVADNQVDLGIIDVPVAVHKVTSELLCPGEVVCVIPEGHPLSRRPSVDPDALQSESVICFAEHTRIGLAVREAFRAKYPRFRVSVVVNQTVVAYSLVQAGAGVALVDPFPFILGTFGSAVSRPFRPRIEILPRLLFRSDRPMSRLCQHFANVLRAVGTEIREQTTTKRVGRSAGKRSRKR